jgi:hypothetical protein
MKWILILIPNLLYAQIFIQEQRLSPESDLVEFREDETSLPKSWMPYLLDSCVMYDRNVNNENELRAKGLRRCQDGSISFVQPDSEGWNGWEGKCGQTAAANSLFHLCQVAVSPKDYVDRYMQDSTPGVRPKVLARGLKQITSLNTPCPTVKNWQQSNYRNHEQFIAGVKQDLIPKFSHARLIHLNRDNKIYQRNPVIVLIQNPGDKYLHWVTIVDTISQNNQCKFLVNHWNRQYLVPCENVASWSQDVGKTYPIILKSYSTVSYK